MGSCVEKMKRIFFIGQHKVLKYTGNPKRVVMGSGENREIPAGNH